jgi:hypothetical protein
MFVCGLLYGLCGNKSLDNSPKKQILSARQEKGTTLSLFYSFYLLGFSFSPGALFLDTLPTARHRNYHDQADQSMNEKEVWQGKNPD